MSTKYLEAKWELLALIWVVLPEMEEKKKNTVSGYLNYF